MATAEPRQDTGSFLSADAMRTATAPSRPAKTPAPATIPAQDPASDAAPGRIASIDLLRGIAMIVMALDHLRDLLHAGAMVALPTNLQTTTVPLFATRWITHFCAPVFALTAGLGAWLWWRRGRSRADLSRFLITRGLWLMVLEISVMQLAYYFSWPTDAPVLLLVLWSLGLSMVVLAGLIWLPVGLLGSMAVVTILLHPLLDGISADRFGAAAGLWNIIHQVGAFQVGSSAVITPYPLVPWVAVVALGFSLGPLFRSGADRRRRWLFVMGGIALAGFLILRLSNTYGDPVPWSRQDSPLFTLLAFLNTAKYPASPAFLLMTLGPALLLLAWLDRRPHRQGRLFAVAMVFGRVPLFYYVGHFYLAHLIATALALITYGRTAFGFVFLPYPSFGGTADRFPDGFGYDLWVTYLAWLIVLAIMYPLCRWYSGLKLRRGKWWLSYL